MRWKTFTLFHGKYMPHAVYQVLSELAEVCTRYDKKKFGLLFSWTRCVVVRSCMLGT